MAKLALQLLTLHQSQTLPPLFASLNVQTDQDWVLYWRLNGSTTEERIKMKQALEAVHPTFKVELFDGETNLGFSGGHEWLYEKQDADYVMCVNDDTILDPEYVERLRYYLDQHAEIAAVSGTILRWDFDASGQVIKSNVIDSLGLKQHRTHKVSDISSGELQANVDVETLEGVRIWGVSGCLPMYRRSAVGPQLFDPSYFLYKEDVDLAYRLNTSGWMAALVPQAIAYHRRTFRKSFRHAGVSFDSQWLSYRNHWRNLRKHLTWKQWLTEGWAILPFEFAKAWYMLFKYALRHRHHHRIHQ